MAKSKTLFVCQDCGNESLQWQGRCPACGEWNTLVEEKNQKREKHSNRNLAERAPAPTPITEIESGDGKRLPTGMDEFDRILGGGIVMGSAVLVGGAPGIGKSTLMLQVAHLIADAGKCVMYVTSEESIFQTRLRAERLGALSENLLLLGETDVDIALQHITEIRPEIVVVDSIQMVYSQEFTSAPGSIGQLRESAARLVYAAKRTGVPVFMVGHVTKGGVIAGPRALEHMVDTVLYFEGDRYHTFRLLRAVKNRFGSTDEIAVYDMRRDGLHEVLNPSAMFLSERRPSQSGSSVVACMQGTRALLAEVQALVSQANFGMAERKVTGADYNRVCMLMAVLNRRVGMQLAGNDVFVNVVGGVRLDEPAADLGIAVAMASSLQNIPIGNGIALIGEVGLGGELRGVTYAEARLREAAKLGFKTAIIPRSNKQDFQFGGNLEIIPLDTLSEAVDYLR